MGIYHWRYLVRNLVFNSKAIVLICINDAVPLPGRPPLPHAVLILGRFTGYTNSGPIYRLYRAAVNQLFAHLREFASFTDCVTTPKTLQCWPTTYFGNLFLQADRKGHAVKYFWSVIQENQRGPFLYLIFWRKKTCDSEMIDNKIFQDKKCVQLCLQMSSGGLRIIGKSSVTSNLCKAVIIVWSLDLGLSTPYCWPTT